MFRIIAQLASWPVMLPPTKIDGERSIYGFTDLESLSRSGVEKVETSSTRRDFTTRKVLRKTLGLPRLDKALAGKLLARLEHLASRDCHLTHSIGRSRTSALSKVLFEIPYQVDPHSSINANSFQYRRIVRRYRAFLVRSLLLTCPN